MARLAIILGEGSPTSRQLKLGCVLDFFGVPWEIVDVSKPSDMKEGQEYVVFGLAQTVATALKQTPRANHSVPRQAAFYVYTTDDRGASERGLQSLCGEADVSLREPPVGNLSVRVSSELADVTGPMAGLEIVSQLRRDDAVLVGSSTGGGSKFATVISAGGAPVFVRFQHSGVPVFFCASSHMVDIDQAAGPGFYDIKDHFCSAVPLVMFLRLMFADVAWRPQELGACLIVDDPLLKQRYGSCDFGKVRDLMLRHEFTTNIGFIPWNWRRTSRAASEFFRKESGRYSISVHGCDHIGAEFGATSPEVLNNKAKLAQSRMQNHEIRTGIHHDPVMIFPQGVFSAVCPAVLKRNGFLAAVNTETVPVDSLSARTKIRDVWDIAIMAYDGFPIFTRRYAFHGLENFAFDLLLGKPCLIVSHHDFFQDSGTGPIELIEKLRLLNCRLRWRPLGEVIRRACRRRISAVGVEEVEMYGNELLIDNLSDQAIDVRVHKREDQADLVAGILCDGKPVTWTSNVDRLIFGDRISPRSQIRFQVVYEEEADARKVNRSLRFELSVAVRRILSEFRDDYLSRNRFLSTTSASLKNVFTKVD
jgi:hypothetical protein